MKRLLVWLQVLLLGVSAGTFAEEGALYARVAPPGSAFIRVFHTGELSGHISARLGSKTLKEVEPYSGSDYIFLPQGSVAVSIGTLNTTAQLKAGHFYTVVADKSQLKVIEDPAFDNKRKALLNFYNLVEDSSLDVVVSPGNVKVFEKVPFGKREEREIKAVKLSLTVKDAEQKVVDAAPQILTRGDAFSLFICGDRQKPRAVWVKQMVNSSI